MSTVVTEPGLYEDMPEADYHAHPALSASEMKKLLPPNAPAIYKYEKEHPPASRKVFDFGKAAHAELLGVGAEVVIVQKVNQARERVDADDYDTKSAKEHAAEIVAEGKTPLLRYEYERVKAMVAAIRADRLTAKLFEQAKGRPEVSLFWNDAETGVPLRARLDFLREPDSSGRVLIVDYKTARDSHPRQFVRSSADFNYPVSAANYADALIELEIAKDVEFLFVAQSKTAPFLPSVVGLHPDDLRRGRALKRRAVNTWQVCTANNDWPGFTQEIHYPELPVWWQRYADEESA